MATNTGYCTLDDLRRALREADLPGDAVQDDRIALDPIAAQTEWLEKTYKRHWYAPTGSDILGEASTVDIPTEPQTRDDEYDLPTQAAYVHGSSEHERHRYHKNSDALLESGPRHERRRRHNREPKQDIRIATGDATALDRPRDETKPLYTKITLDRKDVDAINELLVIGEDGSYTDWVASNDYDGGVGLTNRGQDYWVRINNGGVSDLYLDIHALDDDIHSLSNAVYVDYDYGHEGIPRNVRRGVASWAGAELAEEAVIDIPQNATLYNIETKADELREQAREYLSVYEGLDP